MFYLQNELRNCRYKSEKFISTVNCFGSSQYKKYNTKDENHSFTWTILKKSSPNDLPENSVFTRDKNTITSCKYSL